MALVSRLVGLLRFLLWLKDGGSNGGHLVLEVFVTHNAILVLVEPLEQLLHFFVKQSHAVGLQDVLEVFLSQSAETLPVESSIGVVEIKHGSLGEVLLQQLNVPLYSNQSLQKPLDDDPSLLAERGDVSAVWNAFFKFSGQSLVPGEEQVIDICVGDLPVTITIEPLHDELVVFGFQVEAQRVKGLG